MSEVKLEPILNMVLFIRILILIFAGYYIYKRLRLILQASKNYKDKTRSGAEAKNKPNFRETNKNPYVVLGVSTQASREEIKKAYHELMSKYHPDKVAHLGEELQSLAKEKSQEIVQAYREITCD